MTETVNWMKVLSTYIDDEMSAEIVKGDGPWGEVYRLAWNDHVANDWHEDFPTYTLARKRLAHLIIALTTDTQMFDEPYSTFIGAELGYHEGFEWVNRDFIATLRKRGYEARAINEAVGMMVETHDHDRRITVWADTLDGVARVGFYASHQLTSSGEGAMIYWTGEDVLKPAHADQIADLLDVVGVVVDEALDPHTHTYGPADASACLICGVRKYASREV